MSYPLNLRDDTVGRLVAFAVLLLVTIPCSSATPATPTAQIRALWVDGFHGGFRTPEEADKLVADAVASHLTLLIVQIRRGGYSFYPKSFDPAVEDDPYKANFDALGYLLTKAHSAGLQVHAWVNVTPIWRGGPDPPKDPKHIFNVHGLAAQGGDNWLTETYAGERRFSVGYFFVPR